jgi:hypothetical protein
MPCNRKTGTPLPCQQLAAARAQMTMLMSGGAIRSIETPQLGKLEYSNPPNVADLQRYIDMLAAQCAAAGGDPGTGGAAMRRRPISIEAWPECLLNCSIDCGDAGQTPYQA